LAEYKLYDCVSSQVVIKDSTPPTSRWGHCSAVYQDYIIVFGGRNTNDHNDMYAFHTSSNRWIKLVHKGYKYLPCERRRATCSVVLNGILIFGGFANNKYLNEYSFGRIAIKQTTSTSSIIKNHYAGLVNDKTTHDIILKANENVYYLHKPLLLYRMTDSELNVSKLALVIAEMQYRECKDVSNILGNHSNDIIKLLFELLYSGTIISSLSRERINDLKKLAEWLSLSSQVEIINEIEKHWTNQEDYISQSNAMDPKQIFKTIEAFSFPEDFFYFNIDCFSIRISKPVIYARSQYFRNFITYSHAKDHASPFFDTTFIKEIIQYYYNGEFNLSTSIISDIQALLHLSLIAGYYCEKHISEKCSSYISKLVSPENICFILFFAYVNNDEHMIRCIIESAIKKEVTFAGIQSALNQKVVSSIAVSAWNKISSVIEQAWPYKEIQLQTSKPIIFYSDLIPTEFLIPQKAKESLLSTQNIENIELNKMSLNDLPDAPMQISFSDK
jgi:hypothetical protein